MLNDPRRKKNKSKAKALVAILFIHLTKMSDTYLVDTKAYLLLTAM